VIARPLPRAIVAVLALVLLATATAAPTAAAPTPPVEPELAAKLQQRLDGWRRNHRAPGVAAAVRLPDGSRWLGTSGRAIRGKDGRNVEPHTPFAVASLTKTFVAATILQLRDEGKLQLGMRISRWLPKYPQAKRITIKNLLNHRSGIFDYFYHRDYERKVFNRPRHRWNTREILALRGPSYCVPGTCYRYSNTNYVLLAKIINKVTGRSVATEIRRRFLVPLGLTDTSFQGLERIRRVPAEGHLWNGRGYQRFADGSRMRPHTSGATVAHGAGALVSSVRDISDWQDALLAGEVLSPRSMELMLTFPRSSGYGLGMRVAYLDGKRGLGHGGSLRGFVSIMYRLPQQDLDVVILTNLGRIDIQGLADKLTRVTLNHIGAP
jgi:D-alanyl-D-alanine carboxypeptidase